MSTGQANANYGITTSSKVAVTFPGDYTLCDEGSFFVATQAATATTAVGTSTQALANTNPIFAMFNSAPAPAAGNVTTPNVYVRYLKVTVTTDYSGASSLNYTSYLDNASGKLSTITTPLTSNNGNTGSSVLPVGKAYGGVLIATAGSASGRQYAAGQMVGSPPVVLDEWVFDFGPPVYGKNLIGTTTLVSCRTVPHPPII